MLKLLNSSKNENDLLSLSLDEIARVGARKLLIQALDLEVAEYIDRHEGLRDANGKRVVVRNGKAKARKPLALVRLRSRLLASMTNARTKNSPHSSYRRIYASQKMLNQSFPFFT
jgi:hypothetical protein